MTRWQSRFLAPGAPLKTRNGWSDAEKPRFLRTDSLAFAKGRRASARPVKPDVRRENQQANWNSTQRLAILEKIVARIRSERRPNEKYRSMSVCKPADRRSREHAKVVSNLARWKGIRTPDIPNSDKYHRRVVNVYPSGPQQQETIFKPAGHALARAANAD